MKGAQSEWIERQLAGYGPTRPLAELVEELNRIYHAVEARDYDQKHIEIFAQLPPVWAEMIDVAMDAARSKRLNILDFGCGTGFEAAQVLKRIEHECIAGLTCYDLSLEMLARSRASIEPRFGATHFTSDWREVVGRGRYDLVISNSVLHHLPNLDQTMDEVASVSAPDAVWIAGHEPSSRYYRNPACLAALSAYRRERHWRRLVDVRNYWNRARRLVGLRTSPAEAAARKAYESDLFEREPPPSLISRLVDFHVAHDATEAAAGRGLDFQELAERLSGRWKLLYVHTYSFMGPFYEARLPRRWQTLCKQLAREHPNDGSNFSTVWARVTS